ncbi:hypothetical protein RYD26_06230 [Pasteurellaceae bacterium LIM206]|nr:hypothetical protein [Pasteurellaceae bacterium LIM206]
MKKLLLIGVSSMVLVACSVTNVKPVEAGKTISHICIKDSLNPQVANFSTYLSNSLKKKNISSEIAKDRYSDGCQYVLAYSLRGDNTGYVLRAKLRLSQINADHRRVNLGEVSYKQRGEEKDKLAVSGVQGQTDLMINELFKNY